MERHNTWNASMDNTLIDRLKQIPELDQATRIEPVMKGYSADAKFKMFVPGQGHVLVRVYDVAEEWMKQREYQCLKSMQQLGVLCPVTLGTGRLDEKIGYMILSYIEGEDASERLPQLNEQQQWAVGFEAGAQLQLIHQLPMEEQTESWYIRKSTKHQRYVERYKQCSIVMKEDQAILTFIADHLGWMKNRPDGFQHDDFHPSNLVVKQDKLAGVIDFNRYDQGDPIHEFLKLGLFASEISIPYSIGQIQGYFNGNEPDELFWRLYSLYTAMALVSSVVWIQQVKPEETHEMMTKIERVREDHDDFRSFIPRWYTLSRS
ncbi:aminoglycoside phosphotransferase family protein [Paenibacillus sp. ClWae2A]|uniref:aminoglycoside phosphotransferase family protein n=1 Tax=Paenibacillus sp. ClWae2A TaxID=3057177 RepID=UPI0028F51CF4|nr:aminoglycoside phosphotransferase family protein [Paenibacillus sp. ClWae2A]MDT9721160.1 aminoglycoside phosphotransferase family protein [Paenibacillus sp. ClWae2A]